METAPYLTVGPWGHGERVDGVDGMDGVDGVDGGAVGVTGRGWTEWTEWTEWTAGPWGHGESALRFCANDDWLVQKPGTDPSPLGDSLRLGQSRFSYTDNLKVEL